TTLAERQPSAAWRDGGRHLRWQGARAEGRVLGGRDGARGRGGEGAGRFRKAAMTRTFPKKGGPRWPAVNRSGGCLRQDANDDAAILRAAVLRVVRRDRLVFTVAEHADLV